MSSDQSALEISVGAFMLAGLVALVVLALKVSGLSDISWHKGYHVIAYFDNIGDLKVRAPVAIAGVNVGQVSAIQLDGSSYRGKVVMTIKEGVSLPGGTSASIYTQGILGNNYVSLTPGFDDQHPLKNNSVINDTHPAIILENLIGQFMYSLNHKDSEKKDK